MRSIRVPLELTVRLVADARCVESRCASISTTRVKIETYSQSEQHTKQDNRAKFMLLVVSCFEFSPLVVGGKSLSAED